MNPVINHLYNIKRKKSSMLMDDDYYFDHRNFTHRDGKFYYWLDGYVSVTLVRDIRAACAIKIMRLL